MAAYDAYPKIV